MRHLSHCLVTIRHFTGSTTEIIVENDKERRLCRTVWKYSEFFYSGFTNILCSKFLLTGTLQSNLDLLGKHSDLELWEVLELHDLKDFVQSLPKKLLHEMSEGCENLRVPVMDAGRILEYDTPQNLLQQKGAFFEIVAEAGIRR